MPFSLSRLHFWHKKYFVLPSDVHVTGLLFGDELHDGTILEHKIMGTRHVAIYFFKSCGVWYVRGIGNVMLGHRGPLVERTFALAELRIEGTSFAFRPKCYAASVEVQVAEDESPVQMASDNATNPRRKGFHFPAFQ